MIVCLRTVRVPLEHREAYLAWIADGRAVRQAHGILAELVLGSATVDGASDNRLLVQGDQSMKWISRARPKTDRIACPWLIRRYIDPEAEIVYVPTAEVLALAERDGGHSFDMPGPPNLAGSCSWPASTTSSRP